MKQYLIAIFSLILSSVVAFAAPDKIGITGELVKAYALTQVDLANITASDSRSGKTHDTICLPLRVRSLDDLNEQLANDEVDFRVKNPKDDTVKIEAFLNRGSETIFEATNHFQLEKSYSESGKAEYVAPWYAKSLSFSLVGIDIPFPGVKSVQVVGKDGQVTIVPSSSKGFRFTQELLRNLSAGTLLVNFTNGKEARYDNTGSLIKPGKAHMSFGQGMAHVDGILRVEPWDNSLDIQLGPEWGYNPAIETKSDAQSIELTMSSYYGFHPLFLHVTTYEDLASGISPEVVPYVEGMSLQVTPGQVTLIWCEWHPNVHDSYYDDGGKG